MKYAAKADRKGKPGPKPVEFDARTRADGDCIVWTGPKNRWGYGRVSHEGRTIGAHRLAWMRAHGEVPDGSVLLHKCDNPACVKIEHLEIGTHQSNQADKVAKGRQAKGEAIGSSKLNEAEVRAIRRRAQAGELQKNLAAEFGLSRDTVMKIVNRKLWSHLA